MVKILPNLFGGKNLRFLQLFSAGQKKLVKISQFAGIIEKLANLQILGVH